MFLVLMQKSSGAIDILFVPNAADRIGSLLMWRTSCAYSISGGQLEPSEKWTH